MRSVCVAVPRVKAEEVRQTLIAMGLFRTDAKVDREGDTVFLPVRTSVAVGYPNLEREVRAAHVPVRSYKDIVRIPPNLKPLLPTSFDLVGDLAIVKVPEELAHFERDIAEAVLTANAAVQVVATDEGVKGPFRVRRLRVVAGPPRTETVHREFGLSYRVDVGQVYFSPRLGSERMRIANQVGPGEVVVDLYSGVGPYAILIATRREPRVVYAFDANPEAYRYLAENVRRNRATRVVPRQGDAVVLLQDVEPPHRILIDYPQAPGEAFRAAASRVAPAGVIHIYEILERSTSGDRARHLEAVASGLGRRAAVLGWREVHGWSPTQGLYVFDVRIT